MTDLRIALIAPDGTTTVGGVLCKLVPVEAQREMLHSADNMMDGDLAFSDLQAIYDTMLSATDLDLSGLPRVPEEMQQPENDIEGQFELGWNACIDHINGA